MKSLNIYVEDSEYQRLIKIKRKLKMSWREYVLKAAEFFEEKKNEKRRV